MKKKQVTPRREKAAVMPPRKTSRGAEVVRAIRGRATTKMSTDEIMKLTRG